MRRGRVGRPSLVGTMARTAVVVGTATAVSGSMQKSSQQKAAAQQSQAEAQAAAQQSQAEAQAAAQQAQIDAAVQQAVAEQTPPPQPPAAEPVAAAPAAAAGGVTDDTIAQLQKLAELQKAGVLSDEEFASMKAKVLAG